MSDTFIPSSPPAKPFKEEVSRGSAWQLAKYALVGLLFFVVLLALLGLVTANSAAGTRSTSAVDYATNTITLTLSSEPPQLNSTRSTDMVSGMVLGHVMEGLLRFGPDNNLIPGIAESWELDELGGTFRIRSDAYWSNGTQVTAHDFVFAWQTAVNPETASQYAFILFPIKNGQRINEGELPIEELGARALDDFTLEVELEQATPYFLKLLAFFTYYPINKEFYLSTGGRYGADAEDLIYNGPFRIASWVHGASVRLEKNEYYWNRDETKLDAIDFAYILNDANAVLNLFATRKIVFAGLNSENLDRALKNRWRIQEHVDGSVFFLELNHRPDRLTSNYNLRKALQLVHDPAELVYKVMKLPGNLPGESIFPVWLRGVHGSFRDEYPGPKFVQDEVKAREHLAMALDELGLDELPPLMFLTGDNPVSNKQSEYYQRLYKEKLGIEVKIDKQIFKQRLAKMTSGDFDIVAAGWGPDYDDVLTFGDLFASWNANNRGRYENPELDKHVAIAQSSSDPVERMEAMDQVQKILHDDVAILVQYERGSVYVSDSRVKGVSRRAVGTDPDYTRAYIVQEENE